MSTNIESFGISVEVPDGWNGQIFRRPGDAGAQPQAVDEGDSSTFPVVHVDNFWLPAVRGDFGSGAVEQMSHDDVLVCLLEYEPEAASTALFAHEGIPRFTAGDFDPRTMQRSVAGMAGAQAFFRVNGRAFCVYAVVGSYARRSHLAPSVNRVLEGIEIG